MKRLQFFMFEACPYCQKAMRLMEELKRENPAYAAIPMETIDEKKDPATADRYDYWYVPSFFVDGKKLHEGDITKEEMKKVYQAALE